MKVAVTGASGFIGRAVLVQARAKGHHTTGVCRSDFPAGAAGNVWRRFDEWANSKEPVDVVVHAAAVRHRHGVPPRAYGEINVELTRRALLRATQAGALFVHISSIAVYGWPPSRLLPIDESFPYEPVGPYGRSKVDCEALVMQAASPWIVVQPSITYGPGDTNGMVDKMIRMIARHAFVMPGLGRSRVQLLYIDDFARIVIDLAESPRGVGERVICTYRDPIRVRDLVLSMARIVGGRVAPVGPPTRLLRTAAYGMEFLDRHGAFRDREPPLTREKLDTISVDRCYRIDKMRRLTGTEPVVGYEEGLRKTAQALGLAGGLSTRSR
jgi:nucleoside-diphosphate-sugar epimerase